MEGEPTGITSSSCGCQYKSEPILARFCIASLSWSFTQDGASRNDYEEVYSLISLDEEYVFSHRTDKPETMIPMLSYSHEDIEIFNIQVFTNINKDRGGEPLVVKGIKGKYRSKKANIGGEWSVFWSDLWQPPLQNAKVVIGYKLIDPMPQDLIIKS